MNNIWLVRLTIISFSIYSKCSNSFTAIQVYNNRRIPASASASSSTQTQIYQQQSGKLQDSNANNDALECARTCKLDIIPEVERIFAISDLHTDDITNLKKLKELCNTNPNNINTNDCIVIAGDISHEISTLKDSLEIIQNSFNNCHIFFIPGNHEAWISTKDEMKYGVTNSIEKLELVTAVCSSIGVRTEPCLVGTDYCNPTWIVPLLSWYDDTLALSDCDHFTHDFHIWPWTDFRRCVWPHRFFNNDAIQNNKIPSSELVNYFLSKSNTARQSIRKSLSASNHNHNYNDNNHSSSIPSTHFGIITFSHFLPSCKTLPDWKEPTNPIFQTDKWFDHGQPDISAKFAKVAGSYFIDTYARSFYSQQNMINHIHVFGHSHRPKDFIYDNVRYIHNPVGKPWERELNLCNPNVNFDCIWDTTSATATLKEQNYKPIIRYWEDIGGGKDVLLKNIAKRKKIRREKLKEIMNKTSIF